MNKKFMLDAGHGINTAGKRTPDGIREWTLNNAVCNFIVEELSNYNVEIKRADDVTGKTDVALATRVNRVNDFNPDLFASIHHNALAGKFGDHGGTETYVHSQGTKQDQAFADLVQSKLAKETGLRNRGVKKMSLAVLGVKSNIPAVLTEGGFMDSNTDHPIITVPSGQRAYARAVAQAAVSFLSLKKASTSTQSTHTVVKGDTLWALSQKYGVTVAAIKTANKLTTDMISIGQKLIIPSGTATTTKFFPATSKGGTSFVDALKAINVDSSLKNRTAIAAVNGIKNYTGTGTQNDQLLSLLRAGKLVNP